MIATALMITGAGLVLAAGTAMGLVTLIAQATAHGLADRARAKALLQTGR